MGFLKRIQYNSPVILTFALLSFAALLMALISGGQSNALLFSVYRSSFADPLAYVRVFTHVLGHTGLDHYFGNFMLILLLGPIIEEKYGSLRMLAMILITSFITGLMNIILFPHTALLGASGIVFMLIILSSFVNLQSKRIPVTFILVVCIFIGQEIINGVGVQDNISQLAHIVGGVCGGGIGYYMNREKLKPADPAQIPPV